ncbi:MAG TPA: hypothetical protein VGQ12_17275 [Candidatus Angelobacter sp.]|jgi:hypothetical protein|nr:hypothetical protein [Candidatus Angelobacter sp.]
MPQYTDQLLTYIDILGFRKLVEESVADPAKMERIIEILFQMETQTSLGTPHGPVFANTQNFSDLIIRAIPLAQDSGLPERISIECMILAGIQSKLLLDNAVLIRGGVCLDKFYMEQGFAFGPALVRSHHLAEDVAIYPRIIIDSKLVATDDPENIIPHFIERADDGAYFIDYLLIGFFYQINLFPKYENPEAVVKKHKERVEEKLDELKDDERVRQKAIWLALYHNKAVQRIMAPGNYKRKEALQPLLIGEPIE